MRTLLKSAFTIILTFSLLNIGYAQEEKKENPKGKVYGVVYSNFHTGIGMDPNESAFELSRAYLGYKYKIDDHFFANVKIDVGNFKDEDNTGRFAYFKNAHLGYEAGKISINFGLIDLYQFKTQEKFWGYRYIYKSFQDEHKFGSSADLGAFIKYKMHKKFAIDLVVINGEGYKELQSDNTYKAGLGLSILPVEGLSLRLYSDYAKKTESQMSVAAFVGYKYKKKFRIGAEYNRQNNNKYKDGYHMCGISGYATYIINPKFEVFARFDNLNSKQKDIDINDDGILEKENWNYKKDGSKIIAGAQYSPNKKVKISANYQSWNPYKDGADNENFLFLNLEVKF